MTSFNFLNQGERCIVISSIPFWISVTVAVVTVAVVTVAVVSPTILGCPLDSILSSSSESDSDVYSVLSESESDESDEIDFPLEEASQSSLFTILAADSNAGKS